LGEVRFVAADEGTVEGWLEELFRLHGCRWTGRGEAGVLASEDVRAFHRQAARGLLARGALRLYALTVGGRVAAMYYGMSDHRRAYAYLGGFDPGFRVLSPGSLVIAHAIAEAVREGAREMDFLRGQEAYKYAWGARDRSHSKLTLRRAPSV
jgi:CelD/BcsL family acetyltransferase involved in cellulose biosynthesis